MSMNMGLTSTVTLVPNAAGSTVTGVWRHPYQVAAGTSAEQVELDAAPALYGFTRLSAPGGAAGEVTMTVTKSGFTLTSTHVNETGVFLVWGFVRIPPQWWEI